MLASTAVTPVHSTLLYKWSDTLHYCGGHDVIRMNTRINVIAVSIPRRTDMNSLHRSLPLDFVSTSSAHPAIHQVPAYPDRSIPLAWGTDGDVLGPWFPDLNPLAYATKLICTLSLETTVRPETNHPPITPTTYDFSTTYPA